jgi:hypothetical protein
MVEASVELSPAVRSQLEALAREEGKTVSELLVEGMLLVVESRRRRSASPVSHETIGNSAGGADPNGRG